MGLSSLSEQSSLRGANEKVPGFCRACGFDFHADVHPERREEPEQPVHGEAGELTPHDRRDLGCVVFSSAAASACVSPRASMALEMSREIIAFAYRSSASGRSRSAKRFPLLS